MKKLLLFLCVVVASCLEANALDFTRADKLLAESAYSASMAALDSLMKLSSSGEEKSDVLWRQARLCLITGEFEKGIGYAVDGIKANPSNASAYMWHCACTGRDCQQKPLLEQAKTVPVMMKDLETILNTLGRTDYSEAWQALAEIYYNHPFKSNDCAINFMRKAASTVPSGELRLSTYIFLAKLLSERGWTAEKRNSVAASNVSRYRKAATNIDKCSYLDGKGGIVPDMSDKEEARQILIDARRRYESSPRHTKTDNEDYSVIVKLL